MEINNRLVGVWRGTNAPPTTYHVWIKDDTKLFLYESSLKKWVTFLEFPDLKLDTLSNGSVRVTSGESYFDIKGTGQGLDVFKNGNTLVFESSALTTINTDEKLIWLGNKLSHKLPEDKDGKGIDVSGTYGPSTSTGTSAFVVPKIKVDKWGHIVEAEQSTITVPALVVQNPLGSAQGEFPILLAASSSLQRETGETNKSPDIVLEVKSDSYGKITRTLKIPAIDVNGAATILGNLVITPGFKIKGDIEGNVTGTATPTDHADKTIKYGVGTSASSTTEALYGHVKLLDDLPATLPPSGYSTEGQGIAATPLMVYNAIKKIESNMSEDFSIDDGKYNINWIEII